MIRAAEQLDRSVLDRLEAAARRKPQESPEAVDYDWSCPHRFVRQQVQRLEELAAGAAGRIAQVLTGRLGGEVNLSAGSVTQHYAGRLRSSSAESPQCWLELAATQGRVGLVAAPAATAVGLVQRLLGGGEQVDDPQRRLSPLENDLLLDLLKQVGEGFAAALRQAGGGALQAGQQIQTGPYTLGDDEADEFCRFSFNWPGTAQAEKAPSSPQGILVVIGSGLLESLQTAPAGEDATGRTGKVGPAGAAGASSPGVAGAPKAGKSPALPKPEELRSLMQAHLDRTSVVASAWLGTAQVRTRDIITLQSGDVLLMEQGLDEPVQVEVQALPVFLAQLVRNGGRYAIRVIGAGTAAGGPD